MTHSIVTIIASFFGSLGFSLIFNIHGKRLLVPAFGGAAFWAFYLGIMEYFHNEYLCYFITSLLITIYAEIWARILKTPATTVLITTAVPLIPGGVLYTAMNYAIHRWYNVAFGKGLEALGLAISLAAGIMVVSSLRVPFHKFFKKKKPESSDFSNQ